MQLDVVLILSGQLGCSFQTFGSSASSEKRANKVEPSLDICGAHALKVDNGFGRLALRHQDQAQVVVAITIRGIQTQECPELFLGKIWLFLGDIDVPEVVASSRGVGVKLQRMLKRF